MNFKDLKKELESATNAYTNAEYQLKKHVEDEVNALEALLTYFMPVLPLEIINGRKAVQIYVYEDSTKKTISNKVYYCEDKKIRYQVFKKDEYQGYNPTVEYEGSYAVVSTFDHFSKRNGLDLSDVVEYFIERVDVLPELTDKLIENIEIRREFLSNFKKVAKEFL